MSKTRTGLSETPKASPATPKVNRPSRGVASDWSSPIQGSRLSFDRSQRPVTSNHNGDRRSPKVTTPPEKAESRGSRELELQAELSSVQEDLRKANELIALIEKEKEHALNDLRQAQKVATEANEKLEEALLAQKWAEESSEIEKFRADELEQVGIDSAQKKDEEWQKELETVRNQHALDLAALLSATQDLQRAKQELSMITDAKNQALSHADDATRVAEIYAEKVEILSAELTRVKALHDSKHEAETKESNMTMSKLKEEIVTLKQDLEKHKDIEEKLIEKESLLENLNVDLEAALMADVCTRNLLGEWKHRIEELETENEEAKKLERSASESLSSVTKQLEASNKSLLDAETEVVKLKEKVGSMEMTIRDQEANLHESAHFLSMAKEETSEMAKNIEFLKCELDVLRKEKSQALDNEKRAASSIGSLLEEKSKLVNVVESLMNEEQKNKKEIDSLDSALHKASAEAKEAKETLLHYRSEQEGYLNQMEDLQMALKASNEKFETMLDDAKQEIDLLRNTIEESEASNKKYETMLHDAKRELDCLRNTIEESKSGHECSKLAWEQKEENLLNCLKKSEEKSSSFEKEIARLTNLLKQLEEAQARLTNLLKQSEEATCVMMKEEVHLKDGLKELEAEVIALQEALGEAKIENIKLKGSLSDKGKELQTIIQENEELRTREAVYLGKLDELSNLLEEARAKTRPEENGELTDSDSHSPTLQENGHIGEEMTNSELLSHQTEEKPRTETNAETNGSHNQEPDKDDGTNNEDAESNGPNSENINGKMHDNENKEKETDSAGTEFKMWEVCNIEKNKYSPETEAGRESQELDPKADCDEHFDQTNGISPKNNANDSGTSPWGNHHHKKKKPLLRKFGSLLKKKGTSNQK